MYKKQIANTIDNKLCSSEKTEFELIEFDITMPVANKPTVETVSEIVIILFIRFKSTNRTVELKFKFFLFNM